MARPVYMVDGPRGIVSLGLPPNMTDVLQVIVIDLVANGPLKARLRSCRAALSACSTS